MTARPVLKVREEGHEPGLCPTQPLQDPDELPTIPPHKAGLACCLGHTISDVYPSIAQQSLEPVCGGGVIGLSRIVRTRPVELKGALEHRRRLSRVKKLSQITNRVDVKRRPDQLSSKISQQVTISTTPTT
jgi:hypothetical protein